MTTDYQNEQAESLSMVCGHIERMTDSAKNEMAGLCDDYLAFRNRVARFLNRHFNVLCTRQCYENRLSACCSKEGIITFFADMVINVLFSTQDDIRNLRSVLQGKERIGKCIYLGPSGCLWRIKPIVCEMFLCDAAEEKVFGPQPEIGRRWKELLEEKKRFTWPDRPVLFDDLEEHFLAAGVSSPLMYLHNSPGLLRVKQMAKNR